VSESGHIRTDKKKGFAITCGQDVGRGDEEKLSVEQLGD